MAGVKFSRKEFEKSIKLNEEIQEKISLFGTHFENADDENIELEITPNRPDLYSLPGFMRGFLAFLDKKPGIKQYKLNPPQKDFEVKIDKSVRDIRPFTACSIVKNLKFDNEKIKELINIQEKIHTTLGRNRKKIAIGIYPLEKITLPIKLEARKPQDIKFIPLEADREMNGSQILRSTATGRDYAHLLDNLDRYPVFVDAKNEILSMPPIINSHKTGKVEESTKEIFIECSGFDFSILKKTLNILVTMLADMGGEIYQMNLDYGDKKITPDLTPEKIKINPDSVNKLLGLNLTEKDIAKLIAKMGCEYNNKEVSVPAYRTDILHEVDIIEDIAIAYGYNEFKPEIPQIATIGHEDRKEILKRKISEILIGLGFLETSSYHLLTKEDAKKAREKKFIEVKDSKTEYTVLRSSLFSVMMNTLNENSDQDYPQKIFEIGKIFKLNDKAETGIEEPTRLAVALAPSNFTEIKQVLDLLARMINITLEIEETKEDPMLPKFIDGRLGKILFEKKEIGQIGEVNPSLIRNYHLKMPLSFLEIDLDDILEKIK